MIKKIKAFTLMELLVVIIIIGILSMVLVIYLPQLKDTNSMKSWFVNSMLTQIMGNRIKYNGGYYYDIPYSFCKWWSADWCQWDSSKKCIVGDYEFMDFPNNSEQNKELIKHITSFKLCPKVLSDWTLNDEHAWWARQNPSFEVNFKLKNYYKQSITYPAY